MYSISQNEPFQSLFIRNAKNERRIWCFGFGEWVYQQTSLIPRQGQCYLLSSPSCLLFVSVKMKQTCVQSLLCWWHPTCSATLPSLCLRWHSILTHTRQHLLYLHVHTGKSHRVHTHLSNHRLSLFLSDQSADPAGQGGPVTGPWLVKNTVISDVIPGLWPEPSYLLLPSGLQGGRPGPAVDQ